MKPRIAIERIEALSQRWADLKRYTIAYTRRDGVTETLVREVHDHGHGAAVLPYDRGRGTVLLVRQFRLPPQLSGADGDMIEACAGLLDGNDPADCARREAEEELGYRVSNLRQVASCFMTPGAVTERLTLFLADYSTDAKIGGGGGHPHESEDIEVIELPFTEALAMALGGDIIDAKTVMLLLFLERQLKGSPSPRK
ncbi:MAG: NUDIX domain-containing protein [Rhizobiales bacterium]|nr:NUDIX domain-containing protein [Hyphomicrobiales bacterium]MBI3674893.1 NUDIX domain-containing protein [Hyphomicrobiales bacterium]